MALTTAYITLAEFKAFIEDSSGSTAKDSAMEIVILGACRAIDKHCGRRFYTTSAAETRAYSPSDYDLLFLPDDLNSLTSLKTDEDGDGTYETTWTTGDYSLTPTNAALESKPYTYIKITPEGDYAFPVGVPNSVQLVGKFGYGATSSVPDQVKLATLIQASRYWSRRLAPFGILGNGEFGTVSAIPKVDPDVADLLNGVQRKAR